MQHSGGGSSGGSMHQRRTNTPANSNHNNGLITPHIPPRPKPKRRRERKMIVIGGRRIVVGASLLEKAVGVLVVIGWVSVVMLFMFRQEQQLQDQEEYSAAGMARKRYEWRKKHRNKHDENKDKKEDEEDEEEGLANFLSRINPYYLDMQDMNPDNQQRRSKQKRTWWPSTTWLSNLFRWSVDGARQYNKARGGIGPGIRRTDKDTLVESPDNPEYLALREEFERLYPETSSAKHRRMELVENKLRQHHYTSMKPEVFNNDPERDCPLFPRETYPVDYPTLEILKNWNPDYPEPPHHQKIYQGLCVFDYEKDYEKALNYRQAEVPFVVRNDPTVLRTVERWNHPEYLRRLLRQNNNPEHRAEYSKNNHFMYWSMPRGRRGQRIRRPPEGWSKPTEMILMTYDEWLIKANSTNPRELESEKEHWYFRLIGCGETKNCDMISSDFLFEELPFFQPRENLYMVDPKQQRGIHCRFGMQGVIAENHFDDSRNAIVLLGGERRYILSHPDQCHNLALHPLEHPSGRHSAVDWTDPDLERYPQFQHARSNEVVLQAGDLLYLPTSWFHYIVSLNLNFQCNTRSGKSSEYVKYVRSCGF